MTRLQIRENTCQGLTVWLNLLQRQRRRKKVYKSDTRTVGKSGCAVSGIFALRPQVGRLLLSSDRQNKQAEMKKVQKFHFENIES